MIPTHTHVKTMGSRNISISDEAYFRLAAIKRSDESFTDVINSLTEKGSVLDLAGVLTRPEAREMKSNIQKFRKAGNQRLNNKVIRTHRKKC